MALGPAGCGNQVTLIQSADPQANGTARLLVLSETTAVTGQSGFPLLLKGENFVAGSTAMFQGTALPTTVVTSAKAVATLSAANLKTAGTFTVTLTTPGGVATNALSFTVGPAAGVESYTAFGDSITCGFVGGAATDGPPYRIADPGCFAANAYPYYVAAAKSIAMQDYGIPADQACDIWVRQIGPQGVSGRMAPRQVFSMIIGTNDANAKGPGAYEATYGVCQVAALTWLGVPEEYKSLPSMATWTGGFALEGRATHPTLGDGLFASSQGVASMMVESFGGPVYVWYVIRDGVEGTAAIQVDSVPRGSISTRPPVAMATQNGTTMSVAVARIEGVAAGAHEVAVRWVSGEVGILGVGSLDPALAQRPEVLVGEVPYSVLNASSRSAYSADIAQNVVLLRGEGMDVRFAPNLSYLTGTPAELQPDGVHVTPLGASHLADSLIAVW